MRIAIVEDEASAAQRLMDCMSRYENENGIHFYVNHYSSGMEFLEQWDQKADVVFMDVDMPGINGIETARRMREVSKDVVLIFVTNLAQYAIEGYSVDALDYVLKPVEYYAFKLKIVRVLEVVRRRKSTVITIPTERGAEYVRSEDLWYVEVQAHDVLYHTNHGTFVTSGVLKRIEEELEPEGFYRCNYCYLVNLRHVGDVRGSNVMVGPDELQISRNRKKEFLQQLTLFYGAGGR